MQNSNSFSPKTCSKTIQTIRLKWFITLWACLYYNIVICLAEWDHKSAINKWRKEVLLFTKSHQLMMNVYKKQCKESFLLCLLGASKFLVCVCVYTYVQVSRSCFSPSTKCDLGIELRSSDLARKYLYPRNYFAGPQTLFWIGLSINLYFSSLTQTVNK